MPAFSPYTVWERSGITEHLGGVYATDRLLAACRLAAGEAVLNLGCGTGYTAARLARRQVTVTASDINARLLEHTGKRVRRAGVDKNVYRVLADAHELPILTGRFDGVIVESLLIFCQDAGRVAAEMFRVLKPGGLLGINEVTFRQPPPDDLRRSLAESLGMQPRTEQEWVSLLRDAGFSGVQTALYSINLGEQFMSHLRIDGLWTYLTAVVRNVRDAELMQPFSNTALMRQLFTNLGYGLYICTK